MQTPEPSQLEVLDDVVISVGDDGVIARIDPAAELESSAAGLASEVTSLGDDLVLLPGLIDTHVHAPQWPQLYSGLDLPLEAWLFEHTFPLEARCHDLAYARTIWDDLVPSLLAHGTTTAVYYGSIHEPATLALAEACIRHGQRAFVGRVAMDHPDGTPEYYRDDTASEAVAASHRSIEAINALGDALVSPIITPRFIPACTDALLEGLGELAAATGALVQTHCSESDWEHAHVLDRHGMTDAASLDRFGLLQDRSVLAHAGHLTNDDCALVAQRGAGVAHCPMSNAYFGNAVFGVRRGLDSGMRMGLGTDIAGGPEPSMLRQCGHAVTSSRMLADGVDATLAPSERGRSGSAIDLTTAFWLATAGGADLLGIPAGLLEPGRVFDAVAVTDPGGAAGDPARRFDRVVRGGWSSAIDAVWVDGQLRR